MKKVLSLVLALVLVLGSFSFVSAAGLTDVAGTEFEAAVDRLVQLGVLTGYPDNTFKPANSITRAEFAAAVIRVKGQGVIAEATKGLPTGFSDVPATHWASGYVGVASKLGLVNGMGDGTFAPEAPVTYEQAVTMIIRALGYEVAAQARGAYPYGYLIVANDNGLLDAVKGVQGLPASRGIVAKLLDNSLEVPMMVQVGFGTQTTWVVSGSKQHDGKAIYLLDELGFSQAEGVVAKYDSKTNKVTLKVDGKDLVLTATEGFDFNFYEGLTIKAWYTGNKIAAFTALNEAQYVATTGGTTITLGTATKGTVVNKDATLVLDGKVVEKVDNKYAFDADYAKVVLNEDGEIVWAKGYNLVALAVSKVEDKVVYGYNDSLDIEKFTILLDGKTISADDVEVGDVLFYNYTNKFAVVYNNSLVGEIERVYDTTFRFEGKVYSLADAPVYKDGKAYGYVDADVLAAMMDEEKEVELFLNHAGEVVFVIGTLGNPDVETSFYYGMIKGVYEKEIVRGKTVYPVDILNNEGKVVEYSLSEEYAAIKFVDGGAIKQHEGKFVKVTLEDGVVTDVAALPNAVGVLNNNDTIKGFKVTATYARGTDTVDYRLQPSTLVFYKDADNKDKVVKLADAKFTGVATGTMYVANGRVLVVNATALTGEPAAQTKAYTGLVTNVRTLRDGRAELTFADGKVYVTETAPELEKVEGKDEYKTAKEVYQNHIVSVSISEKTGDIVQLKLANKLGYELIKLGAKSVNISARTIDAYELNVDAVIYDITGTVKTLRIRDLKETDNVRIYLDGESDTFVRFVVVTTEEPAK